MKKIKKFLTPPLWVCLLASLSFPALVFIFQNGQEAAFWAYPVYVLSAYGLTVDCIRIVPKLISWGSRLGKGEEASLRKDLLQNLVVNLGFALFQLAMGWGKKSPWLMSNGAYNLVFALVYLVLLCYDAKGAAAKKAWQGYVVCGWCMLALNLTMSGIVFQMIWRGEGESYPGLVVYAVAAYTFYKLIVAIIRLVQSRHNNAPLLGAARNMGHTEALMSLFSLQTALFYSFGQGFQYQHLMNTLTGTAVCLLTVLGALGMIFHGNRRCKENA